MSTLQHPAHSSTKAVSPHNSSRTSQHSNHTRRIQTRQPPQRSGPHETGQSPQHHTPHTTQRQHTRHPMAIPGLHTPKSTTHPQRTPHGTRHMTSPHPTPPHPRPQRPTQPTVHRTSHPPGVGALARLAPWGHVHDTAGGTPAVRRVALAVPLAGAPRGLGHHAGGEGREDGQSKGQGNHTQPQGAVG
jgi:hypothetical protein